MLSVVPSRLLLLGLSCCFLMVSTKHVVAQKPSPKTWEVDRQYQILDGPIYSVDFSPDGKLIGVAGSSYDIRILNANTGAEVRRLIGHYNYVCRFIFSDDGKRGLSGSWDKTMYLWDIEKGFPLRIFSGHVYPALSVDLSPNGNQAFSAGDGFRLWDLDSDKPIAYFSGHDQTVWTVTFSKDGRHALTGSHDETARIWDINRKKELVRFEGHAGRVKAAEFSPDEKSVATASLKQNIIRLWNAETGKVRGELKGHTDGVMSLAFSPNGRRLASGTGLLDDQGKYYPTENDRTVRLWEIASGREVSVSEDLKTFVADLEFSPDGNELAAGCGDGIVRIWKLSAR